MFRLRIARYVYLGELEQEAQARRWLGGLIAVLAETARMTRPKSGKGMEGEGREGRREETSRQDTVKETKESRRWPRVGRGANPFVQVSQA